MWEKKFSFRALANNVYVVTGEEVLDNSDTIASTAKCKTGNTVIGGGFDI